MGTSRLFWLRKGKLHDFDYGRGINKRDVKASSCKVEGVAIVFCVEPEQLEGILTEALSAYICQ